MKWSWLRAAVLGVLVGPAPVVPESVEAEFKEHEPTAEHALEGHAIGGPGFYVWDEDPREAADWAFDLLSTLGESPEEEQLRSLAVRSAARSPLLTDDLDTALQAWIAAPGEHPLGSSMGLLLCLVPALDRTCLVAAWATSPDERVRRELARALSAPFDAVGVRGALAWLRDDPSRKVRELARTASDRRHFAG